MHAPLPNMQFKKSFTLQLKNGNFHFVSINLSKNALNKYTEKFMNN